MVRSTLFLCTFLASSLFAAPLADFGYDSVYPENLVINNRILLKVNGKPVSVMDVVKKMDLLFYQQFPELASSAVARYQFYNNAWRTILSAVIDDALIMADAEEKEVSVNDGEVREELEKMFGPNVVLNIDQLGMSLEEAFQLLKTELTVARMTAIMVRNRALTEVHPTRVRKKYEQLLVENPSKNYWIYRILSVKGSEHEKVANEVHRLLTQQHIPFEEVVSQVQQEGIEISCSEEYRQSDQDLSLGYRAILQTMSAGMTSAPISNQKMSRIFCFKGIEIEEPPIFKQVEDTLKKELTQEAIAKYNKEYRQRLRKHYGLTEKNLSKAIPEDLQPFALR